MQRSQNEFETENPNKADAVNKALTAVINPVLNLLMSLSDNRLDIIVQPMMIMESIPT